MTTRTGMIGLLVLGALAVGCGAAEPEDGAGTETEVAALSTAFGNTAQIKSAINTAGTGKCLDVAGGYTSIGTPIVQYRCHGGTNQRFEFGLAAGAYKIVSKLDSTKCVGFTDRYADDGVLIRLVSCDSYSARWYVDSPDLFATPTVGALRSAAGSHSATGGCIDVASGLNWDSLWMQVYTCHGGPNQRWSITN